MLSVLCYLFGVLHMVAAFSVGAASVYAFEATRSVPAYDHETRMDAMIVDVITHGGMALMTVAIVLFGYALMLFALGHLVGKTHTDGDDAKI